jgi:hypothetical protein
MFSLLIENLTGSFKMAGGASNQTRLSRRSRFVSPDRYVSLSASYSSSIEAPFLPVNEIDCAERTKTEKKTPI